MQKNTLSRKGIAFTVIVLLISLAFAQCINANNGKTSGDENTEYWALLIAVGIYADHPNKNIPPMLERTDDLYDILIASTNWQTDHIKIIKGEDATITNIIQGLRWLDKMDDEDDVSLIYITTHGGQLSRDIWPYDESDGYDEILSSYWGFTYPTTNIMDDQLNFFLNQLDSMGICLIVDSCHAGGFNDTIYFNNFLRKSRSSSIEKKPVLPLTWMKGFAEDVSGKGRVVLMACQEDDISGIDIFTPFLIDGLRGYADGNMDEIVTAEELFMYAEKRIFDQQPTIYDGYEGELPILILSEKSKPSDECKKGVNHIVDEKSPVYSLINSTPPENSIVCGYITDELTGDPINNSKVQLNGLDNQGNNYWNVTYTNTSGYYSINARAGSISLFVNVKGYFWNYTEGFEIDEYETLWVNVSLYPYPPKNSIVCGFITDEKTGEPIIGADVKVYWTDNQGHHMSNDTDTNSSGFYVMNVAAGQIRVSAQANGYFKNKTKYVPIEEFETLWINLSLELRPPENSIVCGYITDSKTNKPIKWAIVDLIWQDGRGHIWKNVTETNTQGFYSINSAAGEIYLQIERPEYCENRTYRSDVEENKTLWLNVSLEKDIIKVDIAKPLKAIYCMNHRLIPCPKAIIIGGLEIEALVHDYWYSPNPLTVEKVEFYIDDQLKSIVTIPPYSYKWRLGGIIKHKHTIKVMAYDKDENCAEDEITVWKFF